MFIRSPYNYDTDEASNASSVNTFSQTKTQQQFKDECNINRIVSQYAKGVMPIGNAYQPLPEDFYEVTDYQVAMNKVRRAQETFEGLNSNIRARFDNDPGQFVDFVTNPANLETVRELGLAPKPTPSPSPKGPDEGGAQ